MSPTAIDPLADIPVSPFVAALPKVDLHVHAEADARLDRVLAHREGRPAYDWRGWAGRLLAETPPGVGRLVRMGENRQMAPEAVDALDVEPESFIARVVDLLEEGARDGAVLVEARFGSGTILLPEFLPLFREAERRVRDRYPRFCAEAIISGLWPGRHERAERIFEVCLEAAGEGLAGIDFIPLRYDEEADWSAVYPWAERAAAAGLGITAHAGEFSAANLAAALAVPGLRRIGHAVHALRSPRLLELLAASGVAVECSLTCNVILGAVLSYEEHPIRELVARGIPVTLNTDDPVRVATTIGREYAVAAALGFSEADLLGFTRTAVRAAFVPEARRSALREGLREWEERPR